MLVQVGLHPRRGTVQLGVRGLRDGAAIALRPRQAVVVALELVVGAARAAVRRR